MLTRIWAMLIACMIALPANATTKSPALLSPEKVMDEALARNDKVEDKKKEKKYAKKSVKKTTKTNKKRESDEGRTLPRDISKL